MSSPISGFMPIPLAIMPPFMAYQSIVMGDAFGRGFQFGKRKISAMSNEEFNKLDIVKMFQEINSDYHRMIPTVEESMEKSMDLQVTIVTELLKIIPSLIDALVKGTGEEIQKLLPEGPDRTQTRGARGTPEKTPKFVSPAGIPSGFIPTPQQPGPGGSAIKFPVTVHDTFVTVMLKKNKTSTFGVAARKFIQRGNVGKKVKIISARITKIANIPRNFHEVSVTGKVKFSLS